MRELESTIEQMDRELRQLRKAAERMRWFRRSLFTALGEPRAIRPCAVEAGAVRGNGRGYPVDSHVLETVQGP